MEVSGRRADEDEDIATAETDKLCEPCQDEHVTTLANGICRECGEFMCNICFLHHLKARQCRNHVLVDEVPNLVLLKKTEDETEKCKHHEDETIKYFCRRHDIVGCGDCMILGHSSCKPEFIKDLSTDFQENKIFKTLIRHLENMTSANKENEKTIRENKREIRLMHEKALKEITQFRMEINQFLDKAEDDVKTKVNCLKSENENLLDKLEEDCQLLTTKIETVKQKINADIYQGKSLFIRYVQCKPDIHDIESAIAQIQPENKLKKFTFVPDKKLFNIVASKLQIVKFGDLDISQDGLSLGTKNVKELMSIARVRPLPYCKRGKSGYHCWEPGTVTEIDADGYVTVKWDSSGQILGGFRFGYSDDDNEVELI